MSNIVLNRNKSIGKVVFVVEGDKKEHTLLRHVFNHVLDYSVIDVKRNKSNYTKYVSNNNPNSRIFVVSAKSSNLKSAGEDGKAYLDSVFSTLYNDYSLDTTNAAVYYVFDRDNESNFFSVAEKLSRTLKNSRDNGIDANGLLLLSFPCVESYIKSCIDDYKFETIGTPKELKEIVSSSSYQYNQIEELSLIRACNYMLLGINQICGRDLKASDLDDFADLGCKLLSEENDLYLDKKQYRILSLLSVAFIDLGIISINNLN